MHPKQTEIMDQLENAHPGLREYVEAVAGYLKMPPDVLRSRFARGLETIGAEAAHKACLEWEALGIFPGFTIETNEQVAAIWDSPLFKNLLEYGMEFWPPANINLTRELPPLCHSLADIARRG